jgi:hypothetical protein
VLPASGIMVLSKKTDPKRGAPNGCYHLGLGDLVESHVDLGDASGRANAGDKLLTLVASALAGGDCIDDADALRAGGTGQVLGCTVKAPSTLGTFLRSFRWGHARQLDRVSREVMARAWGAGAGPGDEPLTTDLDSIRRRRTRPTAWPRRAHSTTTTPVSGAIIRSSLSLLGPVRLWQTDGTAAQGTGQSASGGPGGPPISCVKPSAECAMPAPPDR